jgi:hypothetical protein
MGPEGAPFPNAAPLNTLIEPDVPEVVAPVNTARDPVAPLVELTPVASDTSPDLSVVEPEAMLTDPLLPPVARPDAMTTAPDNAAAVVPVPTKMDPVTPEDAALADRTHKSPVPAELDPEEMAMEPPVVAVTPRLPPDDRTSRPPAPDALLPTTTLIEPAEPPVAAPTVTTTPPEPPFVVLPVLSATEPDTPVPERLPDCTVKLPDPVPAPPLIIDTEPLVPEATPDAIVNPPLASLAAAPELKTTRPVGAEPPTSAEASKIEPVDVDPPPAPPVVIRTWPPVSADDRELPADSDIIPPGPLLVVPTVILSEPAAPLVATPTAITTAPTAPPTDPPVLNAMDPDAPDVVEKPVCTSSDPVAPVASPDDRMSAPLSPAAPPAATPDAITKLPVAPLALVPLLNTTAPVVPVVPPFAERITTLPAAPPELAPDPIMTTPHDLLVPAVDPACMMM